MTHQLAVPTCMARVALDTLSAGYTFISVSQVPKCLGFFWKENPSRSSFILHLCLQNTG